MTPDGESVGCKFKYINFYFWKERPSLILNTKQCYTEQEHQCCDNADTPDQTGVAPHSWNNLLGVLKICKQFIGAISLAFVEFCTDQNEHFNAALKTNKAGTMYTCRTLFLIDVDLQDLGMN